MSKTPRKDKSIEDEASFFRKPAQHINNWNKDDDLRMMIDIAVEGKSTQAGFEAGIDLLREFRRQLTENKDGQLSSSLKQYLINSLNNYLSPDSSINRRYQPEMKLIDALNVNRPNTGPTKRNNDLEIASLVYLGIKEGKSRTEAIKITANSQNLGISKVEKAYDNNKSNLENYLGPRYVKE